MSCPAQLAMFPTSARLQRIRPDRNEWRWYALAIQPDLFGGAALVRRWGRLGTAGQMRLDLHDNEGAAANALSRLIRHRLRRGYVMVQPEQGHPLVVVTAARRSRLKARHARVQEGASME